MIEKLIYIFWHYLYLAVFVTAAFGIGKPLTTGVALSAHIPNLLLAPLRIAAGMGIIIVLLTVFGMLGFFTAPTILTILGIGLGMAILPPLTLFRKNSFVPKCFHDFQGIPASSWWWITLTLIVGLPLLLSPLQPTMEWDELMYHLPYARFWADQGELAINEWLRYPLFAYNMNLLYGAALVVGDDVLTHLIHAATAALSAVMVFAIARKYLDWRVGLIAVILLLHSTQWGWSNAYVDLGVMLFWTSAFATLALRYHIQDARLSYLAAFFAGIAVGVKYQGLFYLPIFFILALIIEKRLAVLIRAGTIFLIIGGFWYLRSYIFSGDPVHPIGGHLFGFWLWNADDLRSQHSDLDHVRGWRDWSFLPALAAPLFWPSLKPFLRSLIVVTGISVALWFLVSGYWRYLSPIYPLMALLSAWVIIKIWDITGIYPVFHALLAKQKSTVVAVLYGAVVGTALLLNSKNIIQAWNDIYANPETRDLYLAACFPGHALMKSSTGIPTNAILYHLGFEGEIYLLGAHTIGDWFGPGRYSEVLARWNDTNAVYHHLKSMGVDYLLINLERKPFSSLVIANDFSHYFELVNRSDKAALYRLRPL